jgi:RimJ/RimL family protein N-acetyltransferase
VWGAYAIGDLQDAVFDQCEWYLEPGRRSDVEDDALIMIYPGMQPPVLFAIGDPESVERAMVRMMEHSQPPARVYFSIREEHEAILAKRYDVSGDRRPMYRMVLRRSEAMALPEVGAMVRLLPDDAQRLEALYAHGGDFAPDAFDAWQITNGVFYGIEGKGGELVAVGGTHIVDWDTGVAAIGNFYTKPAARRHGYASALLNAIVRDLRAGAVDTIVLNVDQRNANAQQLYERNGFAIYCPFIEGEAHLRD